MLKNKLKKMVDNNLSTRTIAKRYNVSQTTIRYWLYKHNLFTNPKNTNSGKNPRGEYKHKCHLCNNNFVSKSPNAKFCSKKCFSKNKWNNTKNKIETGGSVSEVTLKKYLVEKLGNICQNKKCGWDWSKKCIIEIEHIDGNSNNNKLSNVTLLCPNCHSLTSTYKGKNKGFGRYKRKMRYQQNKSY